MFGCKFQTLSLQYGAGWVGTGQNLQNPIAICPVFLIRFKAFQCSSKVTGLRATESRSKSRFLGF